MMVLLLPLTELKLDRKARAPSEDPETLSQALHVKECPPYLVLIGSSRSFCIQSKSSLEAASALEWFGVMFLRSSGPETATRCQNGLYVKGEGALERMWRSNSFAK